MSASGLLENLANITTIENVTRIAEVVDDSLTSTPTTSVTPNPGPMGNSSVAMETTNPRMVNGVVNLLLMLFNIGGNGLVLFVYHSLFRKTVFNLFVKALASLDLLTALTTMLIDVIMKLRPNDSKSYDTNTMCILSHFQVYANSMASGCVLILIAYQRYRKICHPLGTGMVLRRAKILLVAIGLICLVISMPTIFLYGPRKVKTQVRNDVVETTICRTNPNYRNKPLTLAFYYFLMAAFSIVLGSTCVLYCLVSRSIRNFENRSAAMPAISSFARDYGGNNANDDEDDDDDDDEGEEYKRSFQPPYNRYGGNSPNTTGTLMTSPVHGRNPINHQIHHNYHQQQQQQQQQQQNQQPHRHYNHHHHHHHQRHHNDPFQSRPNPSSPYGPNAAAAAKATPHPHHRANPYAPATTDHPRQHQHLHQHQPHHNPNNGNDAAAKNKTTTNSNNNNHRHHHHHQQQQQRRMSNFTMAIRANVISTQMYRVFTIITVVYIISYLPHLVALILTKTMKLDDEILTSGQRMALEFAYNCPYISTVSNPIIYGFSSSEFRDRVRDLLESCDGVFQCCCCCCCCREDGDGCCNVCCEYGECQCCVCCQVFECCQSCVCCDEDR